MYLLIYFRYNLEICDYLIDYQKFESLKQMKLWIKEMKDINKNNFQVIHKYKIKKDLD